MKAISGEIPVVEMLEKYATSKVVRFHMPGHKGKKDFAFKADMFRLDITETEGSDNLQNPDGVIAKAQELFAKLFNSEYAHFSTNGSTAGILSLIGASGDCCLTERASHLSVFNALALFNKKAVIVNNRYKDGKFLPVTAQQIKKALEENPQIETVLVTYPDYYGQCCDLEAVAKVCSDKKVPLFVDSAHGAHLGVSSHLPPHAMCFCDACVVSVHKTLPALTQSAVVLVNGKERSQEIKKNLNVFNSSSPSYLLMASIDGARNSLELYGREYAEKTLRAIDALKKENRHLTFLENGEPTRLVVDFSAIGLSGQTAEKMLRRKNIAAEFSDERRVVFIISVFENLQNLKKLSQALKAFESVRGSEKFSGAEFGGDYTVMDFSHIQCATEQIELIESAGRIAAENIGFYPPCVPIVLKGEKITGSQIEILTGCAGSLFNVKDGKVSVVKVQGEK